MLPNLHHLRVLTCVFCTSLLVSGNAMAAIDARCESTSSLLIERIKTENLIDIDSKREARIKKIALELCAETEKLVQEQHTVDKEKALENWFFESHPEKAGNRRLKTKR